MRYYSGSQNHREQKPKRKGWHFLHKIKTSRRKYKQLEEASALRLYNPYKTKQISSRFKIKGTILPIIFISWICLLLYLPYFKINSVTYSGLQIIKESEIAEIVQQELKPNHIIWPADNFFIVNISSLEELIRNKFSLNSIIITKIFPNKLNVQLQEKTSAGIYDNSEGYYLIDNDGNNIKYLRAVNANEFIFPTSTVSSTTSSATSSVVRNPSSHVPDYEGITNEFGSLPIIFDQTPNKSPDNNPLLDIKMIRGLISFYNAFQGLKSIKALYFTTNQSETGITVFTDKPFRIRFQPSGDIDGQILKLKVFLRNNNPTDYIDLRFGDRIYWK